MSQREKAPAGGVDLAATDPRGIKALKRRKIVSGHQSLDAADRPGPGETRATAEHPDAPADSEGQSSGRSMREELFMSATDDDTGPLPHQAETNIGAVAEGRRLPPRPEREPKSLPKKNPTL